MDHTAFESIMKQLEELDKLEKMGCNLCGVIFKGSHECRHEALKEQNEIMKLALEFYVNEDNYHEKWSPMEDSGFEDSRVMNDRGQIARSVLNKIGHV